MLNDLTLGPFAWWRTLRDLRAHSEQRRNLESRAKDARWIRSLTFDPLPTGEGKKLEIGFAKVS
jgi:hypothetical protein